MNSRSIITAFTIALLASAALGPVAYGKGKQKNEVLQKALLIYEAEIAKGVSPAVARKHVSTYLYLEAKAGNL